MKRAMKSQRSDARARLGSPYFFQRFLKDVRRAGLVGEERNALVIYIAATSRLLPEPLSLFVKGPSSIGKNFLTDAVLQFFPAGEIRKLTASSDRSWNYQGGNLSHKVVYLKERNEASGPVHPLRALISEKELVYFVTVREGNKSTVKKVVTKGPIAPISTTTKNRVEVDDETRHLSIWLDESPEQTGRIMNAAVENELEGSRTLTREDLKCWHEVQRLLKLRSKFPVTFPNWLRQVAQSVDAANIWARRYFPAFLRAVKAVALMRSFRWTDRELRYKSRILVSFSDLAIATLIFGPVFAESLRRAEDMDIEVRQRIASISARRDGKAVSAWDLSHDMNVSLDKAYGLIRKAESAGTIHRANSPTRANRKLYLAAPLRSFLPGPEEMFNALTSGPRRVKFIHPLTGNAVELKRARWTKETE
jgi:hypothetical protein